MNQKHPNRGSLPALRGLAVHPVTVLSLACLLCGLGADEAREFLRYDRQALLAGEVWRLFTAHLVHLGWSHLWLNVLALVILGNLFADLLSRRDWWIAALLSALAIDFGLLSLDAEVAWYVGLSGVLHGLIVLGGLRLLGTQFLLGLILLAGTLAKLGWEQWQGPLPFTETAAAGPVLVNAHLYGALGGALAFVLIRLLDRLRPVAAPL